VKRLKLSLQRFEDLESVWRAGWLDGLEKLELSVQRLEPGLVALIDNPKLKHLSLFGAQEGTEGAWLPDLIELLERMPGLTLQWRTERYDLEALRALADGAPAHRVELVPIERETFGSPKAIARLTHDGYTLERLEDGGLLASSDDDGILLDTRLLLSLPPHPSRFTALAFKGRSLRFEKGPRPSVGPAVYLPTSAARHGADCRCAGVAGPGAREAGFRALAVGPVARRRVSFPGRDDEAIAAVSSPAGKRGAGPGPATRRHRERYPVSVRHRAASLVNRRTTREGARLTSLDPVGSRRRRARARRAA